MKQFSRNPRKISAAEMTALKRDLAEFGDLSGITHSVDTNEVIGGNQRCEAMNLFGATPSITQAFDPPTKQGTVALGYVEHPQTGERFAYRAVRWTPDQCRRANIIANSAGGHFDWSILGADFSVDELAGLGLGANALAAMQTGSEELAKLLANPPVAEMVDEGELIDRAAELQEKWKVSPGQIYLLGNSRVMCGDSTSNADVARLMDGKKYQAVVTSPPYFLDRSYEHGFTPDSARKLIADVAKTWFDFCVDGGYFFDNFAGIQGWEIAKERAGTDRCEYPAALMHYPAFREAGWKLYAERIWVKPHAMCVGLWVLSTNRPVFSWEYLWTWRKGNSKVVLGPSDLRCRGVWDTSKPDEGEKLEIHKLKELGHDASFPVILPKWAILVHLQEGEIIGEPFCGTGTTVIAGNSVNRPVYGMELDPKWVSVALERWSLLTGATPQRLPASA